MYFDMESLIFFATIDYNFIPIHLFLYSRSPQLDCYRPSVISFLFSYSHLKNRGDSLFSERSCDNRLLMARKIYCIASVSISISTRSLSPQLFQCFNQFFALFRCACDRILESISYSFASLPWSCLNAELLPNFPPISSSAAPANVIADTYAL